MSWFPDMGTVTMIDHGEHVRAIGWLSADHPFPQGAVPAAVLGRLHEFESRWWDGIRALHWSTFAGAHICELCDRYAHSGNIGVPSSQILFVAPAMLAHYVEGHQYRPPEVFITALMASPLPGTEDYSIAVELFRQLHDEMIERWLQQSSK